MFTLINKKSQNKNCAYLWYTLKYYSYIVKKITSKELKIEKYSTIYFDKVSILLERQKNQLKLVWTSLLKVHFKK